MWHLVSTRGLGRAADLGCLLADGDPAGSGEGSPVGPGGGHAAHWPGTAGRGERTLAMQWHWLSWGFDWRPCVTGASWFGLLSNFISLPITLGIYPCLQLAICDCLSHQPFAHPWGLSSSILSHRTNYPFVPAGAVSWGPSVRSASVPYLLGFSPSSHHQCTEHFLPTQTGSSVLVEGEQGSARSM